MWRDLKVACRNLMHARGYTAAAVATLTLAIAANTAIYSAVHAVLLRPLPIRDPAGLVIAWKADASRGLAVVELTYREFLDVRDGARGLERVAAFGSSNWSAVLEGRGHPARLMRAGVSHTFFDTIGAAPLLGRTLNAGDDVPNAARVAVLNHGTWLDRFGGDPGVIGQPIHLDGRQHIVVGVMPAGFDYPRGADLWIPVLPVLADASATWGTNAVDRVGVLYVLGRLRDRVTPAMAADEIQRIVFRTARAEEAHRTVVVTLFLDHVIGPVRQGLWWLLGAVGVLLLVACANVSGLGLTRAVARRRDVAIRLALGAPRRRLARDAVVEATVVAGVAAALGTLAASWLVHGIRALAPADVPRASEMSINLQVAAFTGVVAAAAGLLCAAGPLLSIRATSLAGAFAGAGHVTPGGGSTRARAGLVVVQMALAIVLLVASALVVRSFVNLRSVNVGFDAVNTLTMEVTPLTAAGRANEWYADLTARVEALPDVEAAGAVYLRPLAAGAIGAEATVTLEGQPETIDPWMANPLINHQVATTGYFRAMRTRLLRGRVFDDRDRAGAPRVVVIGESAAERLWPGDDPIGKRMSTPGFDPKAPPSVWHTVVGVVEDIHYRGIGDPRLDVYEPAAQSYDDVASLVVRTKGDPLAVSAAVEREARQLDPRVVISRIATLDAIVARELAAWRLSGWMFALFASFAFALAIVGLLGVASLDVAQRRREFAVRMALGAAPAHIRRRVLGTAAARAGIGMAVGVAGAVAVTRAMRALLYGVQPLDATTYALVVSVVSASIVVASYVPARRAASLDPAAVLKRE